MTFPQPAEIGLAFLASELLLAFAKRSRAGARSEDAHSLRFLWIIIGVCVFLSIQIARRVPAATLPHRHGLMWCALIIFAVGVILRWYAIIHLGRFFTVDVAIAADHQLVETGPYRWVRHPSYTGALLAFLGFGLSLGNWLALVILLLPITGAFVYRMKVEEAALSAGLGESYRAYCRRTKRLLPLVY